MKTPYRALFFACLLSGFAWFCLSTQAQVRLGEPFGDHMVLPMNEPVIIWGTGCPGGDTVRLSVAGQSVSARSDWEGRWEVRLTPMKAGGPYQMLIQIGGNGRLVPSSAANDHGGAEVNDVLIGEIMLLPPIGEARRAGPSAAAKTPGHPYAEVRVFRSGRRVAATYASPSNMQWFYVAQDHLPPGTANLFDAGRSLHDKLHVPVGIVVSANGPFCPPSQSCSAPVSPTDPQPSRAPGKSP